MSKTSHGSEKPRKPSKLRDLLENICVLDSSRIILAHMLVLISFGISWHWLCLVLQ